MDTIIRDGKKREIVRFSKGRIAVARYPDYTEEAKKYLIELYKRVADGDPEKLRAFLDYKTDENEFCV